MAESAPHFRTRCAECGAAFVEEPPVRLNVRRFGAQESFGHPIVNQSRNSMRRVIRLATTDQSVVRVDPDQNQIRHNRRGDRRLNGGDAGHGSISALFVPLRGAETTHLAASVP